MKAKPRHASLTKATLKTAALGGVARQRTKRGIAKKETLASVPAASSPIACHIFLAKIGASLKKASPKRASHSSALLKWSAPAAEAV